MIIIDRYSVRFFFAALYCVYIHCRCFVKRSNVPKRKWRLTKKKTTMMMRKVMRNPTVTTSGNPHTTPPPHIRPHHTHPHIHAHTTHTVHLMTRVTSRVNWMTPFVPPAVTPPSTSRPLSYEKIDSISRRLSMTRRGPSKWVVKNSKG